jgi:alpha-glucosidase
LVKAPWWRDGVIYQIYPRSFVDSNGDGIGDLRGIASRLDYLEWLGIDGIWLNPITVSPNHDWGYDVADYCNVDPDLGDLDALDALVTAAAARGIRVILDLVPNHTSDRHPWFLDARSARAAVHRDWYVWADPRRDGSPPNNWRSVFGGPAWSLDERTGQFYLHNFLSSQPDLNWWKEDVRRAFDDILRFWFDRGIAGFRIDVAHALVKDRHLRDDPVATEQDDESVRRFGLRQVYSMNRPEVHDVFRRWRRVADLYDPPAVLIGETWVFDPGALAAFYGSGRDELDLAFNFAFLLAPFEAAALGRIVEASDAAIPPDGWPVWTLSNHDVIRFPTRWCGEDDARVRCALLALLTLRGTPVLYYGDEIGLPHTRLPFEALRDPESRRRWPESGRDGARTPMHWSADPGAGFTDATVEPWLPLGDHARANVGDQQSNSASTLSLCRDLIALRREVADLTLGAYSPHPAADGVWAWRRGERGFVGVNLSERSASIDAVRGVVRIATRRERDGTRIDGSLRLEPWEGVVVLLDSEPSQRRRG